MTDYSATVYYLKRRVTGWQAAGFESTGKVPRSSG